MTLFSIYSKKTEIATQSTNAKYNSSREPI